MPKEALRRTLALLALLVPLAVAGPACRGVFSRSDHPRADLALVVLGEAPDGGPAAGDVPVAPGAHPLLLSLQIPSHLGNAALEARILDTKGKLVWAGVGLRRHEGGSGYLYVPARFLGPGDYRLAVGRARPDVGRGEFPFRVK